MTKLSRQRQENERRERELAKKGVGAAADGGSNADGMNNNNDGETVVSSSSSGAGIGRNTAAQVTSLYLNNPDLIEDKKIELLKNGFERIDYIEIRNALNLQIENPRKTDQKYRIFIALYLEGIRLIDNIEL